LGERIEFSSIVWQYWFGYKKEIQPIKNLCLYPQRLCSGRSGVRKLWEWLKEVHLANNCWNKVVNVLHMCC